MRKFTRTLSCALIAALLLTVAATLFPCILWLIGAVRPDFAQAVLDVFPHAFERVLGLTAAQQLRDAMRGVVDKGTGVAIRSRYGISADVVWDDFQDPLVSDPGLAKAVAADVNDYAQLEPIRQSMAGEDFCEFAKVTLPVFAFVGSNGQEGCADWHSPHFVGLDESIPTFVNFYVNTALRVLNELK
jgi:hypothetical protein